MRERVLILFDCSLEIRKSTDGHKLFHTHASKKENCILEWDSTHGVESTVQYFANCTRMIGRNPDTSNDSAVVVAAYETERTIDVAMFVSGAQGVSPPERMSQCLRSKKTGIRS